MYGLIVHMHTRTLFDVLLSHALFSLKENEIKAASTHTSTHARTPTHRRAHTYAQERRYRTAINSYIHMRKKEGNEGVEKKKEYERQSAKIKHRSHTKRSDRRGRRSSDAAEYTSTWCQAYTHHQRRLCRRCVMCVRCAVE